MSMWLHSGYCNDLIKNKIKRKKPKLNQPTKNSQTKQTKPTKIFFSGFKYTILVIRLIEWNLSAAEGALNCGTGHEQTDGTFHSGSAATASVHVPLSQVNYPHCILDEVGHQGNMFL